MAYHLEGDVPGLLALAFVARGIWFAAAPASVPGTTQAGRLGMQ